MLFVAAPATHGHEVRTQKKARERKEKEALKAQTTPEMLRRFPLLAAGLESRDDDEESDEDNDDEENEGDYSDNELVEMYAFDACSQGGIRS